jgi:hypothetical protein
VKFLNSFPSSQCSFKNPKVAQMNPSLGIGGASALSQNSQLASRVAVSYLPSLLDALAIVSTFVLSYSSFLPFFFSFSPYRCALNEDIKNRARFVDGLKSYYIAYTERINAIAQPVSRVDPSNPNWESGTKSFAHFCSFLLCNGQTPSCGAERQ